MRRHHGIWILIVGCLVTPSDQILGAAVPEASASSEALSDSIAVYRGTGRYLEALDLATALAQRLMSDSTSPAHALQDASMLAGRLARILELPVEARRKVALADSLVSAVDQLQAQGSYEQAADAARRAASLRLEQFGTSDPEVADVWTSLAVCLHYLGDLAAAADTAALALNVHRGALGEHHPDVVMDLLNLGEILHTQGDVIAAEREIRAAVGVLSEVPGVDRADRARALNSLASVLQSAGDYAAAEPLARKALAELKFALGSDDEEVAALTHNLAALLVRKGDDAGAEPLYLEALRILMTLYPDGHPTAILFLNSLADLRIRVGDLTGARKSCEEAIALHQRLEGESSLDLAISYRNLRRIDQAGGDRAQAERSQQEALRIWEELVGDRHPYVAGGIHDLGLLRSEAGDDSSASSLFHQAWALRQETLGPDHPYTIESLKQLGILQLARGDSARADSTLQQAALAFETARVRAGTGLARAAFLGSPYPPLALAKLRLGREAAAWQAVERDRGRVLAELLASAPALQLTTADQARRDSVQSHLARLEQAVETLRTAARADSEPGLVRLLHETERELLAVAAEWSGLQQEPNGGQPATTSEPSPLDRIQGALAGTQAILGWLDVELPRQESESWAYVIRKDGPVRWARLERVGEAQSRITNELRSVLTRPRSDAAAHSLAAQVYRLRFAPVRPYLAGVTDLVVIPSGAMASLPLECLLDESGGRLADQFTISYIPSSSIYAWLRDRRSAPRSGGGEGSESSALLLGDPPFTGMQLEAMEQEAKAPGDAWSLVEVPEPMDSLLVRSAASGNSEALDRLARLPGTRLEVQDLSELLPGATLLLGPDASEQRLTDLGSSGELRHYRLVHLATHALNDPARPDRSCLIVSRVHLPDAVAAAERGDRIFDGRVTLQEILREWRLDADLVTLSACETGLGRQVRGEGTVGFAHAFLQAGTRSLLVSLWKVDDQATAMLMRRFYENLLGRYQEARAGLRRSPMPKAVALREAKRWLRDFRDERGTRPYAHPFYWSAFVLIGDPE